MNENCCVLLPLIKLGDGVIDYGDNVPCLLLRNNGYVKIGSDLLFCRYTDYDNTPLNLSRDVRGARITNINVLADGKIMMNCIVSINYLFEDLIYIVNDYGICLWYKGYGLIYDLSVIIGIDRTVPYCVFNNRFVSGIKMSRSEVMRKLV